MKSLSTSGLILAAALALAGCSSGTPSAGSRSVTTTSTSTTEAIGAQSTTSSTAGESPSSSTSTTTPPETAAAGSPIQVTSPANGASVASPMAVKGTSRLGGQTVQLVLSDGSGDVLCRSSAVPGPDGVFTATMRFAGSGSGSLAAFVTGPGGAREDLIQVPLHLAD